MLRCQASDPEVFARLYRRYQGGVRAYLSRFVRPDAGEDTLQEVWVTVYRRTAQQTHPGRFRVRLVRIARNKALYAIRREQRRTALWDAAAREGGAVQEPDVGQPRWRAHEIEAAMAHLSPEHCEVLQLRFFEDLGYAEIAAVVGCPIGTIRSRLYHAKAAIRNVLIGQGPGSTGGQQEKFHDEVAHVPRGHPASDHRRGGQA